MLGRVVVSSTPPASRSMTSSTPSRSSGRCIASRPGVPARPTRAPRRYRATAAPTHCHRCRALGAGVSTFRRLLRLPGLPGGIDLLLTLVDSTPRSRREVESRRKRRDRPRLAVTSAAARGCRRDPLGLLVDAAHRRVWPRSRRSRGFGAGGNHSCTTSRGAFAPLGVVGRFDRCRQVGGALCGQGRNGVAGESSACSPRQPTTARVNGAGRQGTERRMARRLCCMARRQLCCRGVVPLDGSGSAAPRPDRHRGRTPGLCSPGDSDPRSVRSRR